MVFRRSSLLVLSVRVESATQLQRRRRRLRKSCPSAFQIIFQGTKTGDQPSGGDTESLMTFIAQGASATRTSTNIKPGWDVAVEGILRLLRLAGVSDPNGRRLTRSGLLDELAKREQQQKFRQLLALEMCFGSSLIDLNHWTKFCLRLHSVLSATFEEYSQSEDLAEFTSWQDSTNSDASRSYNVLDTYIHCPDPSSPTIEIPISTIHAAKGETHTATLVLDTFVQNTHDLKSALPYLVGNKPTPDDAKMRRHRRVFVAMTRPRELLCLALREDHVKSSWRKKLRHAGWEIVELYVGTGTSIRVCWLSIYPTPVP